MEWIVSLWLRYNRLAKMADFSHTVIRYYSESNSAKNLMQGQGMELPLTCVLEAVFPTELVQFFEDANR